jgi:hypothetical protein
MLTPERNRIHVLGLSNLVHAVMLSAMQRGLREWLDDDGLQITFDTSSPSRSMGVGQIYGYARTTPDQGQEGQSGFVEGSFNLPAFKPPSDVVHRSNRAPFPITSSRISEHLTNAELCAVTTMARRSGWDGLANQIIVNHNLDSTLRAIDDANSIMEQPSVYATAMAPARVVRCYNAILDAFTIYAPNPGQHINKFAEDLSKI